MITRLLATTALALALSAPALAQTSTTTTTTDTQAQTTTEEQGSTESQAGATTDSEATGGSATTTTQTGEAAEGEATGEVVEPSTDTSTTATGEVAEPSAETTTGAGATGEAIITQQQSGQIRADKLLGAKVTNAEGEDVGDVNDILLDEHGQVVGVILSVGGFLGIGDKKVAVNWDEIQLQEGGEQVAVSMTKDQISEAPAFVTMEEQALEQQAEGAEPAVEGAGTTGTGTTTTTE